MLLSAQRKLRTPEQDAEGLNRSTEGSSVNEISVSRLDDAPTVLDQSPPTVRVALLRGPGAVSEERAHLQHDAIGHPGEVGLDDLAVADRNVVVPGPAGQSSLVQPATDALLVAAAVPDAVRPLIEQREQHLPAGDGSGRCGLDQATDGVSGRDPAGERVVETTLDDAGVDESRKQEQGCFGRRDPTRHPLPRR